MLNEAFRVLSLIGLSFQQDVVLKGWNLEIPLQPYNRSALINLIEPTLDEALLAYNLEMGRERDG